MRGGDRFQSFPWVKWGGTQRQRGTKLEIALPTPPAAAASSCYCPASCRALAPCMTKGMRFSLKWKNTLAEPPCSKLSHDGAKRGIGFLPSSSPLRALLGSRLLPPDRAASLNKCHLNPHASPLSAPKPICGQGVKSRALRAARSSARIFIRGVLRGSEAGGSFHHVDLIGAFSSGMGEDHEERS